MAQQNEGREPSKSIAPGNGVITAASRQSVGRHLYSKQDVALAVGVSPRTVDNLMARKAIPYIRLSPRLIRFDLERVKTALARYEVKEVGVRR